MIKILENLEGPRQYDNTIVVTQNDEKLRIKALKDNYSCNVYGVNDRGKSLVRQMNMDGGEKPSDHYATTVPEIDTWIDEGSVKILRRAINM